jgi:hypothetical protein
VNDVEQFLYRTYICSLADDKSEARRTRTHYTYMPVIQTRLVVQKSEERSARYKLRNREGGPKEVQSVWWSTPKTNQDQTPCPFKVMCCVLWGPFPTTPERPKKAENAGAGKRKLRGDEKVRVSGADLARGSHARCSRTGECADGA